MRRYRRLLITAIVTFVLLFVLQIVRVGINHGFADYLQAKYPKQEFKLASPVIRLFPLRYELQVYAPDSQVKFLAKSIFSLRKSTAKADAKEAAKKDIAEATPTALAFEHIYTDNYLAQKQAKDVYEQLSPILDSRDYRSLIERYSIQVNQAVSIDGEDAKEPEQARLLLRFRKQVKDKASMTASIVKLIGDLQKLNAPALGAIYCESSVLLRTDESFQELKIPAQTWQKTKEVASSKPKASGDMVGETEALPTEVVASGYKYNYFCYVFNYNLAFTKLDENLITNGLRIQELGGENLERFKRTWHYNYNA